MDSLSEVTIFTTFADISEAYSLNRVVQNQIKMLLRGGYKLKLIVAETFKPSGLYDDKRIEIVRIPLVPVHNEVKKDPSFDDDVERIEQALFKALKTSKVVITHDVIYQNAALKHNFAARKVAAKLPQLRWLHWIHSATSPVTLNALKSYFEDAYLQLVSKPFPNSYYVFFNHYSIPRVAKNFNVEEKLVKVVHHPSDLQAVYGLSDDIDNFCREKEIYGADVIDVYPARLDRGKQIEFMIKTMACLKDKFNLSVRAIVVDFHSTGGDKVTYRDELKQIGIDWGLNDQELIFTSEVRPDWTTEIPHSDVMGLMRLQNAFIMPSVSESYSLVTQEAGLNKSVLDLNFDFAPFRDIFGPHAIYRKYSSNIDLLSGMDGNTDTNYGPDKASPEERKHHEKTYHVTTAGMIAGKLNDNGPMAMSIFLRKFRNLDYVFKHELEPLIYG